MFPVSPLSSYLGGVFAPASQNDAGAVSCKEESQYPANSLDVCKHTHKHMCVKQKPESFVFLYKWESCYSVWRCNHKPRMLRWTTPVVSFKGRQNRVWSVWTFMLLQKNNRLSRLNWISQLHSQRQQSCWLKLYCQRRRSLHVHFTAPVQPQPTAQQWYDILTMGVCLL